MFLLQPFRALAPIFRPPFPGLWLVALLYYTWSYFVYPHTPLLRGDLPDTDDYMYLDQLLDWLKGQGWYDNIQHRLGPPAGVPIHFSRLAQVPMAALLLLCEAGGLGPRGAGTLMALVYPLLLLGGFFAAMAWTAKAFIAKEWAGVTAYIALFASTLTFLFQPGHIDHHGLIVILVTLTVGCVARMFAMPEQNKWGLYAGILMALGLTVALEILPWLLLISAWLGLWAMTKGGNAARNGLVYGMALYVGSFICLTLTRPPSTLFVIDVLSYSIVYVILACGIAISFAALAISARTPLALRIFVGVLFAAGLGFLFLQRFPDLLAGPYGGMDPALAQIILGEINEAQPLKLPTNTWLLVSRYILGALVALVAAVRLVHRSKSEGRWRWGLVLVLLVASVALSLFYQRRFIGMMGMLEILPLAMLLQRGWAHIGAHYRGRSRVYAEMGLLCLVGPLFLFYTALIDGRSFNTGILLFPAVQSAETQQCDMYELESLLRDPAGLGSRQHLILSSLDMGPELLFRTDHEVLSAPYHMDVQGNLDATRFFSTLYPDEAEDIARRSQADLIVMCRYIPEVYVRASPNKMLAPNEKFKDFGPHFVQRLLEGRAPDWLRRVKAPGLENFVVYEVALPKK